MSLLAEMESAVPILQRLYMSSQLAAETNSALALAIAVMKVEIKEKVNIGSESRREEEREIMKSRGEI